MSQFPGDGGRATSDHLALRRGGFLILVGAGRSRRWRIAAMALLVGVLLVIGGAIAQAGKGVFSSFGSSGSSEGEFAGAGGTAVNEATGDVYVVDVGNNRIQQFSATGSFVTTWGWGVQDGSPVFQVCSGACTSGLAGDGAGQLSAPQGVAVSQSTGHVFVSDRDNNRIQEFDDAGEFVRAWGWGVADGSNALQVCEAPGPCQVGIAGSGDGQLGTTSAAPHLAVDPTSGDVYVADPGNSRIQRFDATGGFVDAFGVPGGGDGAFGADSPTRVAVDPTGDVYAVDPGNLRVQRFDSTGTFEAEFAAADLSGDPSPSEIAVNPTDDHVFVVKPCTPTLCTDSPAVPDERRVNEFDAGGTLLDTHAANAGIGATSGLGLEATEGRIYVPTADQVHVLDDIVAPAVAPVEVSSPSATTAWFASTVDPQGSQTGYHFEYSDDGGANWTRVTPDDIAVDPDGGVVQVTGFVRELDGDTDYLARIVATKPFGNPSATSATTPFTTDALAPEVERASSTATHDDGSAVVPPLRKAVLRARVQPQGLTTSYHFEYGTTTAYGATVPAIPSTVPARGIWTLVQETITGLNRNATYHYRIVASNAVGEVVGDDQMLQTGPGLPDDRRYEQVSPVDKAGSDVLMDSARTRAADDGDAVQLSSLTPFADAKGTGVATDYIARRGANGWATHAITPLQGSQNFFTFLIAGEDARHMGELSGDLDTGVLASRTKDFPGANFATARHLFLRRNLLEPGAATLTLLTDSTIPLGPAPFGYVPWLAGASDDFTHVIFNSSLDLAGESPAGNEQLYEWVEGTGIRPAGVLPASEGGGLAERSIAGQGNVYTAYTPNTISRDGSRIIFTVPDVAGGVEGRLFIRQDGVSTVHVNASEKDPADTPEPALYWDSSTDGSKVFFTSSERLTDTPGSGLYRYDLNAPLGSRLTLITVDHEPNDAPDPIIDDVLGASADGRFVYFDGGNQIVEGNAPRKASDSFVFVWREETGGVSQVGVINNTVDRGEMVAGGGYNSSHKVARVTPSGQLIFTSRATEGLTGYLSGSCPPERCREIYVYDPHRNDGDGALRCASCRPDGDADATDAGFTFRIANGAAGTTSYLNHALSDDGRRVFFSTGEALVPEDRNGSRQDVYMYDTENGQLHLLSAGRGNSDAYFMEASPDGDDAFFTTRERLVGWDVDDNVDLYDARVGGGFPEPVPPTPPCVGATCRGTVPLPPVLDRPGTLTFLGPEGVADLGLPTFHVQRLSARAARRLAAGLRETLIVRVSHAGRVSMRAKAVVNGRRRTVAFAAKRAGKGGLVRLRFRLPAAAQAQLERRGRLRLSMAVGYSRVIGAQRANATLTSRGGAR